MSNDIKKLSDYQHIRLRIGMYFGSPDPHTGSVMLYDDQGKPYVSEITWVPALYTVFREILDNALDEVIGHGFGDRIDVLYNETDKIFKVSDNGRGIPIDWDEHENCHKATLVLSNARAGRNFGDRQEVIGTNGIGGSGVNFSSEWFKVEIIRDKKKFTQNFSEGNMVVDDLHIEKPIIKKTAIDKTGTTIEFKASKSVFKHMILPEIFVKSRITEIAAANPLITITYNGERIKTKATLEKTFFADTSTILIDIKEESFKSRFIIVPNFYRDGEFYHSLVNNIPALNGGSHIDQFKKQFVSNLISCLERESKKRKLMLNRSDVLEGLLFYNITNMKAPNFDSQSKTRLINEEAATVVRNFLNDEKLFQELVKKNRAWVEELYKRCAERTMKREIDDINKATKKLTKRKVAKLMEASSNNRQDCILFLGEGDCLHEDTKIYCLNDGTFEYKEIKKINVGDVVLTHKNNLSSVTSITPSVKQSVTIKTRVGDINTSHEHRLFVYNKNTNSFHFENSKNLNKNIHQLVRSRIVDHTNMAEIMSIEEEENIIHDKKYNIKITFINELSELEYIYSSSVHKFLVFDSEEFNFKKILASELSSRYFLVFKNSINYK